MRYNVAQLLKAPTGATRDYVLDEPADALNGRLGVADVRIRDRLRGEIHLMHTTDGILVTGQVHTVLEVRCDRCLERFELPVEVGIEESFRARIDLRSGAVLPPVPGEELETLIDEHHILDLTEVMRQDILLAVPMHPVCRPDCAGLCPECGQNRNEGACDCRVEAIDPRWAGLQPLLDEE